MSSAPEPAAPAAAAAGVLPGGAVWGARTHGARQSSPSEGTTSQQQRGRQQGGQLWTTAERVSGKRPSGDDTKVLEAALKEGDLETAVAAHSTLCAAKRAPHYALTNKLVTACCGAGWFSGAWRAFSGATGEGTVLAYNTYVALLRVCLDVNEGARAQAVFQAIRDAGYSPNKVTYCMLISGLLRASKRGADYGGAAHALWAELEADAAAAPLDAAALRTGMRACVEVGDMEAAAAVESRLAEMGADSRDVMTWNIKIHGLGVAGQLDEAHAQLEAMKAAGVAPDAVTYSTLVNVYVKGGEIDQAHEILADARAAGCVSLRAYATLMAGTSARGGYAEALPVWQEMKEAGCTPNEVAYMTLVQACAADEKFEEAEAIFEEMRSAGHKPSTRAYNVMLQAFSRKAAGHLHAFTSALDRVFGEMAADGVPVQADTFNCVIAVMVQYGEYGLAMLLWDKMLRLGYAPDAVTVTTLMKAFERQGTPDRAVALFSALPPHALDAVVWAALSGILAKSERLDEARDAAETAAQLAADKGELPPTEAFDAVIKGHGAVGDVEEAVSVLQRFLALGGMPDERMYENVVFICARGNALRRAMQVIRAMELSGMTMDREVYQKIVDRVEAAREEQRAYELGLQWEKFKFWLGLPNELYQSDWEP